MPKTWYDYHAVNKIEDDEQRAFYRSIMADKKPYFMRYIYPSLMREYKQYIKKTEANCMRRFGMSVQDLYNLDSCELTEEQAEFLYYYELSMPVGTGDCVMNKICRRFEQEFDGCLKKPKPVQYFNYSIMKSGVGYPQNLVKPIQKLYDEYNLYMQSYAIKSKTDKSSKEETCEFNEFLNEYFIEECSKVCPDRRMLCDIILDICYTRSSSKKFAWSMCGDEIIQNLLSHNNYMISYPTFDRDGNIEYGGERFSLQTTRLEENE